MLSRLRNLGARYPRQFWVMFWGMLFTSIGGSMWWPFITIYLREQLDVPLMQITLLFTLYSAAGLLATTIVGPAVDRFGRRKAMIAGLAIPGLALGAMGLVQGFGPWAIALTVVGMFNPMYRVGADAMVADLIPPDERAEAYSLLRMGNNIGVAIGPAVGGFAAAVSYNLAYFSAGAANLAFALLVFLLVRETMQRTGEASRSHEAVGYGPVLRDRLFLAFCLLMVLATIPSPLMWMLMPAYAKEYFGVAVSQSGFIMSMNAVMVVLLQVIVTRWSSRYPYLRILALGALLYGLGVGSVALGAGFWGFMLSMIILTFGELLLVPTGSAFTANAAPPEMRGRYMGLYGMTWSVAFGIGPVLGGWLNDNIAPSATWIGGLAAGLIGAAGFLALKWAVGRRAAVREAQPATR